jgi:multidrug efflux pump subunit AcrA (membrane-fusion protein)
VRAVREEAARKEAALQASLDEARAAAAAAAAAGGSSAGPGGGLSGSGGGGGGRDLAALLAEKEAELENLQAALGELSYEVSLARGGRGGCVGSSSVGRGEAVWAAAVWAAVDSVGPPVGG